MRFTTAFTSTALTALALTLAPATGALAQDGTAPVTDTAPVPVTDTAPAPGPEMQAALAQDNRAGDRARDRYRHPAQTLAFFQVEPGMTVVDYMPASGWYTRVLAPYLGSQGRYIGLTPDPEAADGTRFAEYFAGLPEAFRKTLPEWNLTGAPVSIHASQDVPAALKGTVDRVLIFREMHNILRSGVFYTELSRIRDLLADDGMVGIVQHRAKADAPGGYTLGDNGYLRQTDVVALMGLLGFDLVGASEVNANPADPADWDGGVWSLPPSYRGAEEGTPEYARRQAIGESDRMTLLFRKRQP